MRKLLLVILAGLVLCAACIGVYNLPPVYERLSWRVANLRSQVYYALNPPEQAVFLPQQQNQAVEAIVQATLQAMQAAATVTSPPTANPTLPPELPSPTPEPSATPTLIPTPIPSQVTLTGITHEYQQMNNCGPATLAMTLSFWGWQGDQRDTRAFLRPMFKEVDDKNVSPEEMVVFVQQQTGLKALARYGGDIDLLKRLAAAGFPVMVEKGFQPPKEQWMGHYQVINGYDDSKGRFITQDSYIMPDFPLPYEQLSERWWRDFNYVFLLVYPPEREAEALQLLGAHADLAQSYQRALETAQQEVETLQGRDLVFAWFNLGSSLAGLGRNAEAAAAYDQAFALYAGLPEEQRPWRMLWYQHGPYAAYYHSGRYTDVIELANTTLSVLSQPILEETLYWRGLAREASGDAEGARNDLERAVLLNPNFSLAVEALR
jgi:hypothetical protein